MYHAQEKIVDRLNIPSLLIYWLSMLVQFVQLGGERRQSWYRVIGAYEIPKSSHFCKIMKKQVSLELYSDDTQKGSLSGWVSFAFQSGRISMVEIPHIMYAIAVETKINRIFVFSFVQQRSE